jgi:hypothetical protein
MTSNVTDVVDNIVIKIPPSYKTKTGERGRRKLQHLGLYKACNWEQEEQELIKRGYVLHIPKEKEIKKRRKKRSRY